MSLRFTIGTHNLHGEAGVVTLFAALIVFTEAIPARIRAKIQAEAWDYRMAVCRRQPDLTVVYRRSVFKRDPLRRRHYRKYVDGVAKVTPNRGTFSLPLIHRATGRRVWVNAEHRINAAFPPFIRGEGAFREAAWHRHTEGTLRMMRRQAERGHLVVAAGDTNTPHGVRAYPGYSEAGEHFDRIGSTARLSEAEVLSRAGSDHHRRRAVLEEG